MMRLLLIGIIGLVCSHCAELQLEGEELPYYNSPEFTPNWIDSDALEGFHVIPDFNLTNQLGQSISAATFNDKVYVADFFFTTCPGICPKMTTNMAHLQDVFIDESDVLFLSHSVTPTIDSVSRLRAYADEKGVMDGKWHLVTGHKEEIYRLGRQAYFVEEDLGVDKDLEEFLHTENFVLIDKNKHIRGIYNGLSKVDINYLIQDIHTLIAAD